MCQSACAQLDGGHSESRGKSSCSLLSSRVLTLFAPQVSTQLKDTKFAREGTLLDKFQRTLANDELRAWYGESHVLLAAARGAIGTLLISDGLFRAADPQRRKAFVALVEDVRNAGGEAAIFSGLHESGRQLNGLTGIAAILRYPMDVEVVEEEEREEREKEEAERKKKELEEQLAGGTLRPNPNR